MQTNTPESETPEKEINLERKVVKLNEVMWGSYRYLRGILGPGDFIIPMRLNRMDNDTYVLVFKVVKAEDNS